MKIQPKISANAMTVLKERYFLRNKNRKIIETPAKLFKRVAIAVASADKHFQRNAKLKETEAEFYNMMASLDFLPNSPTLMNAGTEIGQLSACFTKEQPILCNPGTKSIAEIKEGDQVVSHSGRVRKVIKTYKRRFMGHLYKVKVNGIFNQTLSVTEEHPILSIKKEHLTCKRVKENLCNGFIKSYCLRKNREYKKNCEYSKKGLTKPVWNRMKELKKGDFVVVSTIKDTKDSKKVAISNLLPENEFVLRGKFIKSANRRHKGKEIPNEITIDNDFMRLVGYWLADGSISCRHSKPSVIRFTFNKKERRFYEDVLNIMKKKFNLECNIELNNIQNTAQLRFNSTLVAQLFYNLFGKGFSKKDLPEWFMYLPLKKQFNLMIGLFRGDGSHRNTNKQDMLFISLSNEKLAYKVWNILCRLGYNFNIRSDFPKGGTKTAYRLSSAPSDCEDLTKAINKNKFLKRKRFPQYIKLKDYVLRPITRIERVKFNGTVHNIEVEKDHSYLANGVAVHNCFVLPIEDSLDSIYSTLKNSALIHKSGGGTGFSFSKLRPSDDTIASTKGTSSGPISFMKIFDKSTEVIKQGGKRRGANNATLAIDHPDIEEFITIKSKHPDLLSNFNLSVAITDSFMRAVENNSDFTLYNPRKNSPMKSVKARKLFNLIVDSAWKCGDPCIIFIDTMNKANPTPKLGKFETTNPCGESPLLPYESCNLGSINLSNMLIEDSSDIDWEKLSATTHSAVHFLDNVIEINHYPLKDIETISKQNRKIGLGVMGFADMLIKLGIPYDSEKSVHTARKVMQFIQEQARSASEKLAKQRGSFPNFKKSRLAKKYKMMRNATVTAIAPTGTISLIANCSSGIEPIFSASYVRIALDNKSLININPLFKHIAKKRGFYSKELMKKIAVKGSVRGIKAVPADVQEGFATAHDIKPSWHIKIQAALQEFTDNSISKTINMPNSATRADIAKALRLSHQLGCKGTTVYRDKSKSEQVLYTGKECVKGVCCP